MKKGGHTRCIKSRQINSWSKRLRFQCPSGSVSEHSVVLDDFGSQESPKEFKLAVGTTEGNLHIFKGTKKSVWKTCSSLGTIIYLLSADVLGLQTKQLIVLTAEGVLHIFSEWNESNLLTPTFSTPLLSSPSVAIVADVDGDGKIELVVGRDDLESEVHVFSFVAKTDDKNIPPKLSRLGSPFSSSSQLNSPVPSSTTNSTPSIPNTTTSQQPQSFLQSTFSKESNLSVIRKYCWRFREPISSLVLVEIEKKSNQNNNNNNNNSNPLNSSRSTPAPFSPGDHSRNNSIGNSNTINSSNGGPSLFSPVPLRVLVASPLPLRYASPANSDASDKPRNPNKFLLVGHLGDSYSRVFVEDQLIESFSNNSQADNNGLTPKMVRSEKALPPNVSIIGKENESPAIRIPMLNKSSDALRAVAEEEEKMGSREFERTGSGNEMESMFDSRINRTNSFKWTVESETRNLVGSVDSDGWIRLRDCISNQQLYQVQLDHDFFSVRTFNLTSENGEPELVAFSHDGIVVILNKNATLVRYHFEERIEAATSGFYSVDGGRDSRSLVFVSYYGEIFLYYDVALRSLETKTLLAMMAPDVNRIYGESDTAVGRTSELSQSQQSQNSSQLSQSQQQQVQAPLTPSLHSSSNTILNNSNNNVNLISTLTTSAIENYSPMTGFEKRQSIDMNSSYFSPASSSMASPSLTSPSLILSGGSQQQQIIQQQQQQTSNSSLWSERVSLFSSCLVQNLESSDLEEYRKALLAKKAQLESENYRMELRLSNQPIHSYFPPPGHSPLNVSSLSNSPIFSHQNSPSTPHSENSDSTPSLLLYYIALLPYNQHQ